MLDKELAEFRLTDSAAHIHNWVRGMNPWPMAWFVTGGKKVKVTECRAVASNGEAPALCWPPSPLTVACADGAIQLLHVVPEGKTHGRHLVRSGSAAQSGGIPCERAEPRAAAAVSALVRQEQDGFSNLVLDAELKRQQLEGRDKAFLPAPSFTRCWNTGARWTIS